MVYEGGNTMELNNVIFEKEGNIGVLTINRPKALNALNSETLKDLDTAIDHIEKNKMIYMLLF